MSGRLIDPFLSFDRIGREEMNRCLVDWDHKMGPINRPEYARPIDFALRRDGQPVAVIAADTLIRPTCGFDRSTAFEMSRLCGPEPRICSIAMRLWRQFAYPEIVRAWKASWVISYQDATAHTGNLYRYDGWVRVRFTTSGKDPRALPGTAEVRRKVIWAWTADPAAMASRREALTKLEKPKWAA